jgi:hypothetical protein
VGFVAVVSVENAMLLVYIPPATYLFVQHPNSRIVRLFLAILNITGVVLQSLIQANVIASNQPRVRAALKSVHALLVLGSLMAILIQLFRSQAAEPNTRIRKTKPEYTLRRRKCRFICRCGSLWISFLANVASLIAAFCATDGGTNDVAFVSGIRSNAAGWTFVVLSALGNWQEEAAFFKCGWASLMDLGRLCKVCLCHTDSLTLKKSWQRYWEWLQKSDSEIQVDVDKMA